MDILKLMSLIGEDMAIDYSSYDFTFAHYKEGEEAHYITSASPDDFYEDVIKYLTKIKG